MRSTHTTRTGTLDHILLGDKQVEFRLISSSSATKLRVRVGIAGIEVIQPEGRDDEDVLSFLQANSVWIIDQLDRVERFRNIRRPKQRMAGRMLFSANYSPFKSKRTRSLPGRIVLSTIRIEFPFAEVFHPLHRRHEHLKIGSESRRASRLKPSSKL